jgi:hypothetical protein
MSFDSRIIHWIHVKIHGYKGWNCIIPHWYGGYGITLSCLATSGIISCFKPKCWLINVGLVTKHGYSWVCCIGTSTCGPLLCLV